MFGNSHLDPKSMYNNALQGSISRFWAILLRTLGVQARLHWLESAISKHTPDLVSRKPKQHLSASDPQLVRLSRDPSAGT